MIWSGRMGVDSGAMQIPAGLDATFDDQTEVKIIPLLR